MFRASYIFFIVIALATKFPAIDAAFEFWMQFFDRWFFGSNNPLSLTQPRIHEGDEAETQFINNEYHKLHRPAVVDAQIKQSIIEMNRWIEYRKTNNPLKAYIAGWALDTLWEKQLMLNEELKYAIDDVDMEPFCHHRHHNQNRAATDLICYKAFQNPYFKNKGWRLDQVNSNGKFCSRVTVYSLHKNEKNKHRKLVFYREARRCQAYTLKSSSSLDVESRSYFGVYLISHDVYLTRKQFSYFVLLRRENMDTEEETPSDPKSSRKTKFKKAVKYLSFLKEKEVQILAYIEN